MTRFDVIIDVPELTELDAWTQLVEYLESDRSKILHRAAAARAGIKQLEARIAQVEGDRPRVAVAVEAPSRARAAGFVHSLVVSTLPTVDGGQDLYPQGILVVAES